MRTSRSLIPLALSAAAAATLTACGSSSAKSSGPAATVSSGAAADSSSSSGSSNGKAAPAACSLLTTDEISKATGQAFNDGKTEVTQDTPFGKYTVCVWSGKAHPLNTVRVSVWDQESAFEAGRKTATDVKDSSGVGSKSFTASFASVFAVADGHTLFVQYYSLDGSDSDHLPISTSLAKTASARL